MSSFTVRITAKGQITIPKELRNRFHLVEGELATLIPAEEGIVMKHQPNPLKELRGLMRRELDIHKVGQFIRRIRADWRIE